MRERSNPGWVVKGGVGTGCLSQPISQIKYECYDIMQKVAFREGPEIHHRSQ